MANSGPPKCQSFKNVDGNLNSESAESRQLI